MNYSGWEPKPLFDNNNPDPRVLSRPDGLTHKQHETLYPGGNSNIGYPTAEPVNHPTAGQLWVDTQTGKTYAYVDSAGKVMFNEDYHWRMQRVNKETDIAEYGRSLYDVTEPPIPPGMIRMKRYESLPPKGVQTLKVMPAVVSQHVSESLLNTKTPNLLRKLSKMKKG